MQNRIIRPSLSNASTGRAASKNLRAIETRILKERKERGEAAQREREQAAYYAEMNDRYAQEQAEAVLAYAETYGDDDR